MFRNSAVVISLTPDALEGAHVVGARVTRTARQPLDRERWSEAWEDGLLEFDGALASVLRELGVRKGTRVSVLVQSPSDAVEISSFPSAGPDAVQAAMLRVEERVVVTESRAVSDGMVVAHDEADGAPRTHVLACAADNAAVQAVFGWVSRSGNRLEGHVPRAVVPLVRTLEAAEDEQDCVAFCYLDWSTATIASMFDGSLAFVRTFNAGYQSLAEAYARGVARLAAKETEQEDGEEIPTLDMSKGADLLIENGVPSREARIGEANNPYRSSVAPLLASVMQRLSVEIKQSVRYGVRQVEQRPRRLVLLGPGARIPGMAALLSETTELDVELHPSVEARSVELGAFSEGTTEHAFATDLDVDVSLIPIAAVERLAAAGRSSAVRAGAILAVGLLVGEAGLIALERTQIGVETQRLQSELLEVRARSEAIERAAAQIEELNVASFASSTLVGDQPSWSAVLGDIGARTPGEVNIRDVRAFYEGRSPMVAISGFASDDPNARSGGTLGSYIDTLKASPLVERVELGTTRTETHDGVSTRSFSVTCYLRAVPFEVAHPQVYAGVRPSLLDPEGAP